MVAETAVGIGRTVAVITVTLGIQFDPVAVHAAPGVPDRAEVHADRAHGRVLAGV